MVRRALLVSLALLALVGSGAVHGVLHEEGGHGAGGHHEHGAPAHEGPAAHSTDDCGHPHEPVHEHADCLTCSIQRILKADASATAAHRVDDDRSVHALHTDTDGLPGAPHGGVLGARGPPAVTA